MRIACSVWFVVILLAGGGAFAGGASSVRTVEAFRALPDNRIAVHTSYGVRSARALNRTQIEVTLGMTASISSGVAGAWRVISHDDPVYAYEKFVRPAGATKYVEHEAPGVKGCAFAEFFRTVVTLDLPHPLTAGKTYHVLAQGNDQDGIMVTAAHCAATFVCRAGESLVVDRRDLDLAVMGLRTIEPVGPGLLLAEFGANFSPGAGARAGNYRVTINGQAVGVRNIGRRTMVETYIPHGWPYKAVPRHEIFLELEKPFKHGDAVTIQVAESVTEATRSAEMRFLENRTLSNSIKVNQIGYLTDSPAKTAYIGRWMGSFLEGRAGANPSLLFPEDPSFALCDSKTGKVVFNGKARLIHTAGEMNEGVYKHDHSGENVYQIDFTAFKTPGEYIISVPQTGCSLPFRISDDVYVHAFRVQGYGLFAQRCGIELKPPYSEWRRIACHRAGLIPTTVERLKGRLDIKQLANRVDAGAERIEAYGGHHDAGDYNPRSRIEVAQTLLNAYEIRPQCFYDRQLNIPEAGNGTPDILDEAFWALRLWFGLQDKDGGVHNGTESNGDPNFIQSVELDPLGDYAFAKSAAGSLTFAAVAAQASRVWASLGKQRVAESMLQRAVRAYTWASQHPPDDLGDEADRNKRWRSPRAYAAAELLLTTGDRNYNRDFLEVCVWRDKLNAPLDVHKKYDQQRAAWAYSRCPNAVVDLAVKQAIRKAIIEDADYRIAQSATMAYGFVRHPWAPINWGTGAYQNHLKSTVWAWHLTGDEKYRLWMIRTCDNTLGANPLNRSYIVGAGTRTVRAPLHNSRYSHFGEVVMGQQVQGPNARGDGYRVRETAYPRIRDDFASLYTFCDNHFAIGMDEGLSRSQAMTLSVFGLLLPEKR